MLSNYTSTFNFKKKFPAVIPPLKGGGEGRGEEEEREIRYETLF